MPTIVYSYGCLTPDVNADIVEDQFWMRYRYRQVLTHLVRERDRRRLEVFRGLPELATALNKLESCRRWYDVRLTSLRDHKRQKPKKDGDAMPIWQARLQQRLRHYRATLASLSDAEHAWTEACLVAESKALERPDDYVAATPKERKVSRAAQAFAKWAQGEPDRGGPNSKKRREINASIAIARWTQTVTGGVDLLAALGAVDAVYRLERHAAQRAVAAAGLPHGSYAAEEDDFDRAVEATRKHGPHRRVDCPERPNEDRASVGIQISGGLELTEMLAGKAGTLRLVPQEGATDPRYYRLSFRIGTLTVEEARPSKRDASRKVLVRSPLWTQANVLLHRPLPQGAKVMLARLQRQLIGQRQRWSLQLTLRLPDADPLEWRPGMSLVPLPVEKHVAIAALPRPVVGRPGIVALNIGWRRRFDEDGNVVAVRAGYWLDDTGKGGEVLLPAGDAAAKRYGVLDRFGKADDLRSIRDKRFDDARDALLDHIGRPRPAERPGHVPEWLWKATAGLITCRSADKLRSIVRRWGRLRHQGDAEIYNLLAGAEIPPEQLRRQEWRSGSPPRDREGWLPKDLHLHQWEADVRAKAIAWRRDVWLKLAYRLATTYGTVVNMATGDQVKARKRGARSFDITTPSILERPRPDAEEDDRNRAQRRTERQVAAGDLRAATIAAAKKHGAKSVQIDPSQLTQRCALCGFTGSWDARADVLHTCAGCGVTWDQDENACRNMLAFASGPVTKVAAGSLDVRDASGRSGDRDIREMSQNGAPKSKRRDRSKKAA